MSGRANSDGVSKAWQPVKKLLAVRLDSMGDVLMTTPALAALKDTFGCQLTLLTSPSGASAAAYIPVVDEIIVYEAPWMKAAGVSRKSEIDRAMIDRLRAESFDAAVIFTVYSQNPLPAALTVFLAEIPRRLAHCRENPYSLLTDWVKESEPERGIRHEVQRQLDLVAAIGCRTIDHRLRFSVPDGDRQKAADSLTAVGLDTSLPFVVVHPGASAASRRYPPEAFVEVVRLLSDQGTSVLLTGSVEEVGLVEKIRCESGGGAKPLAGRLTLGQLGALLESSSLLIANNTGPVHLAAAVGTPVVDLYALTNPQHTPWMVPHITLSFDVPCRWCYKSLCPQRHHDCLRKIEPSWVAAAANALLAGENPEQFLRSLPDGRLFRRFPDSRPANAFAAVD